MKVQIHLFVKMKIHVLLVSLFIIAMIESKPLDRTNDFDAINEIPYENNAKRTKDKSVYREKNKTSTSKLNRHAESFRDQIENNITVKNEKNDVITEENSSVKPQQSNNFSNFLTQLSHFSPQLFIQDRLQQLKTSLENLGFNLSSSNATTSKQFATTNSLLHLVSPNDSGFYTDRFEPVGFFGGNGWLANKGGILGVPGAILSTGSLLTDYPTPYKK